jgi:hypothetical protein
MIARLVGPSRQPDSNSAFTVTFRSYHALKGDFSQRASGG